MYRWLNSSTANRRIIPLKSICHEDKTKGTGTRMVVTNEKMKRKRKGMTQKKILLLLEGFL